MQGNAPFLIPPTPLSAGGGSAGSCPSDCPPCAGQDNPCSSGSGTHPAPTPSSGGGLDGRPSAPGPQLDLLPNQPGFKLSDVLRTITDDLSHFKPSVFGGQGNSLFHLRPRDPTVHPLPGPQNPFSGQREFRHRPFTGGSGINRVKHPILPGNHGGGGKPSPCEWRCVGGGGTVAQNYGAAALPHIEYSSLEGGPARSNVLDIPSTNLL